MSNLTIGYGALLTALGVGGFVATGSTHLTALIPAGFGVVALGFGLLARREKYRMHAMHGAVLVGLLGFLGTARSLGKLPVLLSGGDLERPVAVVAQLIMAVLSAGYVAFSVRSFIQARQARQAAARS